ncbi:MAG: PEGA domain-containing protein [Archangium sp.]|nr:PEGA domain-containing protein [Archangium sp.]
MTDDEWKPTGPTMSSDGSLEGRFDQVAPTTERPPAEAPLELEARPAVEGHVWDGPEVPEAPPPKSALRMLVVVLLLALVLISGGAFLLLGTTAPATPHRPVIPDGVHTPPAVEALLPSLHHSAIVDSTPPGASILVNGEVVGVTPWAGDNVWGNVEVELRLKGFQPWRGRLSGAGESSLSATLKR